MEALKDVLSYQSLVHAVAGATGGFTAMTVFYPLDKVRTLLQVDEESKNKNGITVFRELIEREGMEGLYRGWFPVICSLWCSNFVYFYSYNFLKRALFGSNKPSAGRDLTAASIADAFKKITHSEGLGALWNGTGPSLLLVCNPTIQFVLYEALKRRCFQYFNTKELSGLVLFLMAATAKAAATILTYPVQVLQSKLRANVRGMSEGKRAGLADCVKLILRTSGWTGFYKGMETKLLQTILTAALMFLTYEKIAAFVFRLMRANQRLS